MSVENSWGRAVFVLGMHRSGTSSLTGSLEECGLALGHVNRLSPHNRKGNLEDPRVMELHEDLLRHNGGSWHRPPHKIAWNDEHRRQRDLLLADYRGDPIFGIKDPRTLLMMEFWCASEMESSFVGSFRHPLAVAESLRSRNSFPTDRALDLWAHYNRLLVRWCDELAFDLVSFDLPRLEYAASVVDAARGLGLAAPDGELTYFESELRHHRSSDMGQLPTEIEDLYGKLLQLEARHRLAKEVPQPGR